MPASKKKPLLVTLDDEYVDKPASVIASLKKAGLSNLKHMQHVGVVSGQALPSKVAALRKIRGVRAVEEDRPIQLPSPDSPIQ